MLDAVTDAVIRVPRDTKRAAVASLSVLPKLYRQIIEAQRSDSRLSRILQMQDVYMDDSSVVRLRGRLYVPSSVRAELLAEGHRSQFVIHLGATKMYKNLRRHFWWHKMKKYVATFVSQYLTCQYVKTEPQLLSGLLQHLRIPQWKWEHIIMNFMVGLPRTQARFDGI